MTSRVARHVHAPWMRARPTRRGDRSRSGERQAIAIQVDEPAIREGLPLRRQDWAGYLTWAVDAFLLATSSVRDETQIHSHMCYSEFGDILEAIARMDADVLSVETSRSKMELSPRLPRSLAYPNAIGPGVNDIHSPRVPSPARGYAELLAHATEGAPPITQLWVNPACRASRRAGGPESRRLRPNRGWSRPRNRRAPR